MKKNTCLWITISVLLWTVTVVTSANILPQHISSNASITPIEPFSNEICNSLTYLDKAILNNDPVAAKKYSSRLLELLPQSSTDADLKLWICDLTLLRLRSNVTLYQDDINQWENYFYTLFFEYEDIQSATIQAYLKNNIKVYLPDLSLTSLSRAYLALQGIYLFGDTFYSIQPDLQKGLFYAEKLSHFFEKHKNFLKKVGLNSAAVDASLACLRANIIEIGVTENLLSNKDLARYAHLIIDESHDDYNDALALESFHLKGELTLSLIKAYQFLGIFYSTKQELGEKNDEKSFTYLLKAYALTSRYDNDIFAFSDQLRQALIHHRLNVWNLLINNYNDLSLDTMRHHHVYTEKQFLTLLHDSLRESIFDFPIKAQGYYNLSSMFKGDDPEKSLYYAQKMLELPSECFSSEMRAGAESIAKISIEDYIQACLSYSGIKTSFINGIGIHTTKEDEDHDTINNNSDDNTATAAETELIDLKENARASALREQLEEIITPEISQLFALELSIGNCKATLSGQFPNDHCICCIPIAENIIKELQNSPTVSIYIQPLQQLFYKLLFTCGKAYVEPKPEQRGMKKNESLGLEYIQKAANQSIASITAVKAKTFLLQWYLNNNKHDFAMIKKLYQQLKKQNRVLIETNILVSKATDVLQKSDCFFQARLLETENMSTDSH